MTFAPTNGLHLVQTEENVAEIAVLSELLGGSVGLSGVMGNLNRQARRSFGWFGRAASQAIAWDDFDRRTRRWYPQGITTDVDANRAGNGEAAASTPSRALAMTWYAKEVNGVSHGSRISFLDLATLQYRHVLLVTPKLRGGKLYLEPVKIHAGGIVWAGDYLHLAATARGLVTCRLDDIVRVPLARQSAREDQLLADEDEVATFGYSHLLPVRFSYQARTEGGQSALRYSFMSLDRASAGAPYLVCGEYGRGEQTTRLARIPLDHNTLLPDVDPTDPDRHILVTNDGVAGMQGVAVAKERYYLTVSHGSLVPGSMYVGRPGALRPKRLALPVGPEDIAYDPETDRLWTLSEHPRRRWIVALKRSWFV